MTTKTNERFEPPAIWFVGSMAIVPAIHERLNVRLAGQFRFVQRKDPAAEDWRRILENKWQHNRPAYYAEVKALWEWYRELQTEIDGR
jgi:hypothetical protein